MYAVELDGVYVLNDECNYAVGWINQQNLLTFATQEEVKEFRQYPLDEANEAFLDCVECNDRTKDLPTMEERDQVKSVLDEAV